MIQNSKRGEYLESHPKVLWVNYAGLKSSPYNEMSQKITNGKASGILSFGIAGDGYAYQHGAEGTVYRVAVSDGGS